MPPELWQETFPQAKPQSFSHLPPPPLLSLRSTNHYAFEISPNIRKKKNIDDHKVQTTPNTISIEKRKITKLPFSDKLLCNGDYNLTATCRQLFLQVAYNALTDKLAENSASRGALFRQLSQSQAVFRVSYANFLPTAAEVGKLDQTHRLRYTLHTFIPPLHDRRSRKKIRPNYAKVQTLLIWLLFDWTLWLGCWAELSSNCGESLLSPVCSVIVVGIVVVIA